MNKEELLKLLDNHFTFTKEYIHDTFTGIAKAVKELPETEDVVQHIGFKFEEVSEESKQQMKERLACCNTQEEEPPDLFSKFHERIVSKEFPSGGFYSEHPFNDNSKCIWDGRGETKNDILFNESVERTKILSKQWNEISKDTRFYRMSYLSSLLVDTHYTMDDDRDLKTFLTEAIKHKELIDSIILEAWRKCREFKKDVNIFISENGTVEIQLTDKQFNLPCRIFILRSKRLL